MKIKNQFMRIKQSFLVLFLTLLLINCSTEKSKNNAPLKQALNKKLDVQGHRGARGLMPENTIPAFIKALDLGVTTLELDLAVTKDNQLLVSHEPYMNPEMCLDSLGNEILDSEKYAHNIYQMSYTQIKAFDCGVKSHPRFPNQTKLKISKPLLSDVIDSVNNYLSLHNREAVFYNIEIKTQPEGDKKFHPTPEVFSDLVYTFIQKNMNPAYVNIQSFDFRVLKYFRKTYPEIKLALLIEEEADIDINLNSLGFVPEIYSCDFKLLSKENIAYLQSKDILVIPWTVNTIKDMNQLISWNVDGIITDYPDSLQSILN
jgi:glycerophosphoryl diester phosphodiesterase